MRGRVGHDDSQSTTIPIEQARGSPRFLQARVQGIHGGGFATDGLCSRAMDAPHQPPRSRAALVWGAVIVLSGGLLGGAWWARRSALAASAGAPAAGGAASPTAVELVEVERGPFELRRRYTGTLEAVASFIAAPRVGGRVVSVAVDLGDEVEQGQLVARIDDTTLRRDLGVMKAELGVAKAERVAASKALTIAERNYDRVQTLARQGVLSSQDLDAAQAQKLDAEADVAVARARAARAEAAVRAAAARAREARVVLAWDGGPDQRVVSRRHVDPGETIAANAPVVTVVDLSEVIVVVYVTEADHVRLRQGQAVTVRADSLPHATFEGRVDRIAPVLDASSRQARVEMRIPNPEGELTPGMFVRVSAVLDAIPEATSVPTDAVVERGGETVVFIVQDGVARAVPVRVRARGDDTAAVEGEGLGTSVVVLGVDGLSDGDAVRVVASAEGP